MELEEAACGAPAAFADERALAAVACHDRTPDRGRDTPGVRSQRPRGARRVGCGEAAPLEIRDEDGDGAVQDLIEIARRHRVPEQFLRAAEVMKGLLRDRHVQADAAGRDVREAPADLRERMDRSDHPLDLPLALVPRLRNQLRLVFRRDMRRQNARRRQRQRPVVQRGEQGRDPTPGAGHLDAVVGRPFAQPDHLGAPGEQRGAAVPEIKASTVDLRQRAHQDRRSPSLLLRQLLHCRHEFRVRELFKVHRSVSRARGICARTAQIVPVIWAPLWHRDRRFRRLKSASSPINSPRGKLGLAPTQKSEFADRSGKFRAVEHNSGRTP
jgi:hypothetical protein